MNIQHIPSRNLLGALTIEKLVYTHINRRILQGSVTKIHHLTEEELLSKEDRIMDDEEQALLTRINVDGACDGAGARDVDGPTERPAYLPNMALKERANNLPAPSMRDTECIKLAPLLNASNGPILQSHNSATPAYRPKEEMDQLEELYGVCLQKGQNPPYCRVEGARLEWHKAV